MLYADNQYVIIYNNQVGLMSLYLLWGFKYAHSLF